MEVIGPYVLAHQFVELGRQHNYTAIEEKYAEAVAKTENSLFDMQVERS